MKNTFSFSGKVDRFPYKIGWYFVRAPKTYTNDFKNRMERGLVAVTATVKDHTWNTSLLPFGDGTLFIALPAPLRKKYHIDIGDTVLVSFTLRNRRDA